MTSRVVRDRGALKKIIISCDQMDCTTAVDDEVIKDGGGLKNMGWEARFVDNAMRHYCPEHRRTKE